MSIFGDPNNVRDIETARERILFARTKELLSKIDRLKRGLKAAVEIGAALELRYCPAGNDLVATVARFENWTGESKAHHRRQIRQMVKMMTTPKKPSKRILREIDQSEADFAAGKYVRL